MIYSAFDLYAAAKHTVSSSYFRKKDLDYSYNGTALYLTVEHQNFEMVKLLDQNGADVNHVPEARLTPLSVAADVVGINILSFLLDNDARDVIMYSALQAAVEKNKSKMVDLLLRRMCLTPAKGYLGRALVGAVRGHCEYVDILLSYGADSGYHDQSSLPKSRFISALGETATWFHGPSDEELLRVVFQKLLHKTGPLSAEVMAGFLYNMIILVVNHYSPNKISIPGPLHAGIMSRNQDVVLLLIDYSADINITTEFGTPLFFAAALSIKQMVKLLISKGAQIMPYDSEGNEEPSPLVIAASKGRIEIVKMLLDAGAEVDHGSAWT
ncbi:hypothetical protein EYC80_009558 [Monilinia laxa]|uniref:Uncharacterized protein n=1 Tax=Monilinia laxa TaxID=61186 RepID=A0A5N6JY88_MONLA|nr:hypothetical protein EYC80_009558 [Monilinia laxa]